MLEGIQKLNAKVMQLLKEWETSDDKMQVGNS